MIETERLILRPLMENDSEALFANCTSDPYVAKYCSWYPHSDIEETKAFLRQCLDAAASGFKYRWGIVLKENNELIGCIDVVDMDENGKIPEIGYMLSKKFWGNGYVAEAAKEVIKKLFDEGFNKITAVHAADNTASGKVLEKCGMKFVGTEKGILKKGSDESITFRCYEITKE